MPAVNPHHKPVIHNGAAALAELFLCFMRQLHAVCSSLSGRIIS
ncbi:hypothetical protein [[Clostridium] hylemonae]|nr:hypothetical protein [[Clostridium] hylemonae]